MTATVVNPLTKDLVEQTLTWPGPMTAPWQRYHGDAKVFGLTVDGSLIGLFLAEDISDEGVRLQALDVRPDCRFKAPERLYRCVGMALIVLAALLSQDAGSGGMIGGQSKTNSLGFYEALGFARLTGTSNKILIYDDDATALINRYNALGGK